MTCYSMSDNPAFRCPVCRAEQTLREVCRRCQADLRLVVRAHRRLDYLNAERARMRAAGNAVGEQQLATEIRWLTQFR